MQISKEKLVHIFRDGIFYFSLSPLIFSWVLGLGFNGRKFQFVLRSMFLSLSFLFFGSLMYFIYNGFLYFSVASKKSILFFLNWIFFLLHSMAILFYFVLSFVLIYSFVKQKEFSIYTYMDRLIEKILNVL
ncbi:MAG: hypothetical protein NZ853_01720 [Leptospiraceae bacterium]|nr:hypothetical protein [Leptospiraceae bacterium]MDW7976055.1 hypothetical protein [Leptospiraceae bacterium]